MLLVVDIGNTNLVLGVFQGEKLTHSWRVVTRRDQTADEYAVLCRSLFRMADLSYTDIEGVIISSVVPPLNEPFQVMVERYFHRDPVFIEPDKQSLMPIRYRPPSDVGADRIVTAVAAYQLVKGATIVVDFGTATTFDTISAAGEYLGGAIAPGLGVSTDALFSRAARLPRIEIRRPERVIGNTTEGSIQSGVYHGYVSLVEGILSRIQEELGPATVIATGGWAHLIAAGARGIDRIEEDLTLYGLRILHQHLLKGS